MKAIYLPEGKQDFVFAFVGNPLAILLPIAVVILLIFLIFIIRKKK